jgi:hypothetical protein
VAGGTRSACETSIDGSLRLARQPRGEQREHEENDTNGNNTSDQHG